MDWTKKRVLVTGAGGFIGSHLTEHLVTLGAKTRALVHYNSGGTRGWLDHSSLQKEIDIVHGDIRDPGSVRQAMESVDVVFHLAALIAIPYSYSAPSSYVQTNVNGTLNVLQSALELETEKVVHTSTSEVYGSPQQVPIPETHPLRSQSPYAATKTAADKLAESFYCAFGLPVATIRPFNTFGERQSARAVIPTIISQALAGEVIRLGNTSPTRNFNYVANTVSGFVAVAQSDHSLGEVINIGETREVSIGDLAQMVLKIVGKSLPVVCEEKRVRPEKSEVDRLSCDADKARRLLGWKPKYSLEDGLTAVIDWIAEHSHHFRTQEYTI